MEQMSAMYQTVRLPSRKDIAPDDTWDLTPLFPSDEAWETAFVELESLIPRLAEYRGTLSQSAGRLAQCLTLELNVDRLGETLGNYAFLKSSEDQTNQTYQRMVGRFHHLASLAAEAASFIQPEVMAIDEATIKQFLNDGELADYRLLLERMLRYKPHTLGPREERLLAMQSEMAQATSHIFSQLHDADLKFGLVTDEQGRQVELSPSTFTQLLQSPDRDVRRTAFQQFYQQFSGHQHSLAAMLNGSLQKDAYYAKARNFSSALDQALFADNVPRTVYDNLIAAVRKHLPALYRFYDLRRRAMQLSDIHHYDTYVPILSECNIEHTWDQAVEVVTASLAPLGTAYCETLREGLRGRWCDRYPNQGKRSGAFSAGGYQGPPYILMNFKPQVLNDVFTLAHEAGHSMHTYLSARHQPFQYYNYTIFVAEVASTFNEQLLSHYLLERATDDRQRAFLINNEIDDIRATIYRQTMFAEFEKITHEKVEAGEPMTVEALRTIYGQLLQDYFGPHFAIDDELSLECLRIPHFYHAFYVYKYATGMSAAIALSQQVLHDGPRGVESYLEFLRGGCSQFPLDLLRGAGVDLEHPEPVERALQHFAKLVDQLDALLT